MSGRTSEIFEGLGSSLAAQFSGSAEKYSDGKNCAAYDRINVYLTVSLVSGGGQIDVWVEYSDDGTNYYKLQYADNVNATAYPYKYGRLSIAQGYYMSFPTAGKFFRLHVKHIGGTSVTVSRVVIEGKS